MKKIILTILLVLSLILITGCSSIGTRKQEKVLTEKAHNINVVLSPKEYEILGPIYYKGTTRFKDKGGPSYSELAKLAEEKYGADDVINITIDKDTKWSLTYLPWYFETEYTMRGIAIKYKH